MEPEAKEDPEIDLTEPAFRLTMATGFVPEGDVWGVERAINSGATPLLVNPHSWPLAPLVEAHCTTDATLSSTERIAVMDELVDIVPGVAFLRPPSLVVGVALLPTSTAKELLTVLTDTLATAGLARSSVAAIAVPADCMDHPAVVQFGHPLIPLPASSPFEARPDERQQTDLEQGVLELTGKGAKICVKERGARTLSICVVRRSAERPRSLPGSSASLDDIAPLARGRS